MQRLFHVALCLRRDARPQILGLVLLMNTRSDVTSYTLVGSVLQLSVSERQLVNEIDDFHS